MLDYARVRARTVALAEPLAVEDQVVQTMTDASPTKWHLAHTTWFFETFLLEPFAAGYAPFEPAFKVLFNSYYNAVGEQFPRPRRGTLSRPTVAEVAAYRRHVDDAMAALLARSGDDSEILRRIQIGLHHEQQHQELLLTDVKTVLAGNPLHPAYVPPPPDLGPASDPGDAPWIAHDGGRCEAGCATDGFHFDNERPVHRVWLEPFALAPSPVTNAQWRQFVDEGGYSTPSLWLSDGWDAVQRERWTSPLYWQPDGSVATLHGRRDPDPGAPVSHVSFYEADAFARWAGKRLPTEFEWEVAARAADRDDQRGTLQDDAVFEPVGRPVADPAAPRWLRGEVWEWTASAYLPYRGYRAAAGALGEYNGKFMSGQRVLRGGSCATGADHLRLSYRNFFPPEKRWQFTGLRLAEDR